MSENVGVPASSGGRATGLRPQPRAASSRSSVPNAGSAPYLDLIAKCEAASAAYQRAFLIEAWELLNGSKFVPISPKHVAAAEGWTPFQRMLQVEAFESAAISLVPHGHSWRKYIDGGAAVYGGSLYGGKPQVRHDGFTPVFSLALCAAVLRLAVAPILKAEADQARRDRDGGFAGDAEGGSTAKQHQPGPCEDTASPNLQSENNHALS